MADSVDITWKTKGFDAFMRQVSTATKALNGVPGAVTVSFTGGRGGGANAKGAGGGTPLQQARANAQQQVFFARVQAAQARAQVAAIQVQKAQAQLARVQTPKAPKTFSARLMDVLKTTRFNAGAASPLVGRTLALLGPEVEALAGPIGLVVGALTAAGSAVWNLAQSAAEAGNAFTRLQNMTGGSGATAAKLSVLGSAGGLDAGAQASLAQSIQERISSDPIGMAAGAQLGVRNLPGYWGDQDYARQSTTVIEHLRAIKDPTERIRLARAAGAEAALPIANLSDKQFAYTKQDAQVKGAVMTPKFLEESGAFQAAMARVGDAFTNVEAALAPAVLQQITSFLNKMADTIQAFAMFLERNQSTIASIVSKYIEFETALFDASHGDFKGAGEHILNGVTGKDDRLAKSLEDNTKATNKNSQMLGAPGAYGNVTRQGVTGAGMENGYQIKRAQDAGGFILSSF